MLPECKVHFLESKLLQRGSSRCEGGIGETGVSTSGVLGKGQKSEASSTGDLFYSHQKNFKEPFYDKLQYDTKKDYFHHVLEKNLLRPFRFTVQA